MTYFLIYQGKVAVTEVSEPMLAMSAISVVKVMEMIRKGKGERRILESGEILVVSDSDTAPFSWMKYIVLSMSSRLTMRSFEAELM